MDRLAKISRRNRLRPIYLHRRTLSKQRGQPFDEFSRSRNREMRGDGGFVLPLFMKEQPRQVFAIRVDMVGNAARLGAGPGAMLATQGDDFLTRLRRDGKGC